MAQRKNEVSYNGVLDIFDDGDEISINITKVDNKTKTRLTYDVLQELMEFNGLEVALTVRETRQIEPVIEDSI